MSATTWKISTTKENADSTFREYSFFIEKGNEEYACMYLRFHIYYKAEHILNKHCGVKRVFAFNEKGNIKYCKYIKIQE